MTKQVDTPCAITVASAAPYNPLGLLIFAFSKEDRRLGCAAHTDKGGKGRDRQNYRRGHADACQRLFAYLRDVSDEHFVHQIV